ncbi:hypothetical protein BN1723_004072 [Verticillium longisporum]|uniref:U three protein 7 n=1 Tax=Verticillium longisporum TaxID=100787 RepID=A0A0G4MJX4_VERLO|nr:hypothetical protein BN1723_004072 [Verticillium longisporum]
MEGTVSRTDAAPARQHSNGATAVKRRTNLLTKSERDKLKRRKEADQSYGRGKKVNLKTVRDKKLRSSMKRLEGKFETAALRARDAEILLEKTSGFLEPETELERTYKKNYVYIYDKDGVELHCLKKHREVTHMEFLPYHFLLCTMATNGWLKYQDTSTGQIVTELPTKLGPPTAMTHNPYNAIIHAGHQNGTVTLWSPNSHDAVVKLLAHRGAVRSAAVDREGRYMVTTGQDCKMAIWDIRMFKEVHQYFTRQPASSVAISETGLTAVGWGTQTTVWKGLFSKHAPTQEKVQSPYMTWGGEGKRVERVRWCPFEDTLGMGHDEGFSSIIVPGAGEANFDALEVNPFETAKQRQEAEAKGLLNKLQPEMIALDPNFIGNLDLRSDKQRRADKDLDAKPENVEEEIRNRARGKNGALKKYLRKQRKKNIIDEKRMKVDEIWNEQQKLREKKTQEVEADLGPALSRFVRKA